jgi:hypothetical protein
MRGRTGKARLNEGDIPIELHGLTRTKSQVQLKQERVARENTSRLYSSVGKARRADSKRRMTVGGKRRRYNTRRRSSRKALSVVRKMRGGGSENINIDVNKYFIESGIIGELGRERHKNLLLEHNIIIKQGIIELPTNYFYVIMTVDNNVDNKELLIFKIDSDNNNLYKIFGITQVLETTAFLGGLKSTTGIVTFNDYSNEKKQYNEGFPPKGPITTNIIFKIKDVPRVSYDTIKHFDYSGGYTLIFRKLDSYLSKEKLNGYYIV